MEELAALWYDRQLLLSNRPHFRYPTWTLVGCFSRTRLLCQPKHFVTSKIMRKRQRRLTVSTEALFEFGNDLKVMAKAD